MAENTFQLTIDGLKIEDGSTKLELTYNSQSGGDQVDIKNKKGVFARCRICELSYSKAVYQPGKINFTLLFTWTETAPSVEDFYEIFDSCAVGLLSVAEDAKFEIAESYYIFNIKLERRSASKSQMYVVFEAYSPDKYLTLDKYCKAYVGRKLIADVIANKDLWPDAVKLFENLSNLLNKNPRFLYYDVTTKDKQTQKNVTTTYEYIQPYLVQYNESFFDFIVRTTNRCGEFFYFEGGKFNIGWAKPSKTIYIENFASIQYCKGKMTAWEDKSLSEVHNDYTTNTDKLTSSDAKMMRDSELASDENLTPLHPAGAHTTWEDFALWPDTYWVDLASSTMNKTTFLEMVDYVAWRELTKHINAGKLSADVNDDYKDKNLNGTYAAERAYVSADPRDENDKNGIYPYSTTPLDSQKPVFGLVFYNEIQKGIAEAEQSRIHVVLEDNFYRVSLGSLICFEDTPKSNDAKQPEDGSNPGSGKSYIVVKIDHVVKSDLHGAAPNGRDEDFGTHGEMLEIEAIPYVAEKPVYPPSANVPLIKVSNAQRATVTHNADPLKMGRVRVLYPWQKKVDDSTPWIRIALPMASKDSGFRFIPEVGDEAVINYENGNIERPYVEGMLFSEERKPSYSYKSSATRVFSSVNGHSIIFSDPSDASSIINSFSPIWGAITTFFPTLTIDPKPGNKAMGGIQLTDSYGLYSISMSSDKRAISIDSPLGKVDINAFTGISINAPNGDVKIVGKNVEIVAGNNLTLRSGANIDFARPFESNLDLIKAVTTSVVGKFTFVDLSSIRTVFEAFLRPIAGTLRISSGRYLCLEAGKGTAEIMNRRVLEKNKINNWAKFKDHFLKARDSYLSRNINTVANPNQMLSAEIPIVLNKAYNKILTTYRNFYNRSNTLMQNAANYQRCLQDLRRHDLNRFLTRSDIPNANDLYNNARQNPNPTQVSMKDNLVVQDRQVVNDIQRLVDDVNRYAILICRSYIDEERPLYILKDDYRFLIDDSVKGKIKQLFNPVLPSVVMDKFRNNRGVAVMLDNIIDRRSFREVMFTLLKKMVNCLAIENEEEYYTDVITASEIGTIKDFDTDKWRKFVNNIKRSSGKKDILKSAGMKLLELEKFKGYLDQYIWDNNDGGKILFSDENGKTLNINNGTLHIYKQTYSMATTVNGDDVISEIRRILNQLS